ncbi:hypothetical protein HGM15179_009392, partial [Zosterops borbonicus]
MAAAAAWWGRLLRRSCSTGARARAASAAPQLLTAMDIGRVRSSYLTTKLFGSSVVDCFKVREKIVLPRTTAPA